MRVKCINDSGMSLKRINNNVVYEVLEYFEKLDHYKIIDNFGEEVYLHKARFKVIDEFDDKD